MSDKGRLQGKVVLVTGSGRGIGRSEAIAFAREGAAVVVNDIGSDGKVRRADAVVAEIQGLGGQAIASFDDISRSAGAENVTGLAVDTFGGLDIVVNNAGLRAANRVEDFSEEEWDLVMGSHLRSTFLTTKFAIPIFRTRGGGLIINTGSEAGMGMPFNSAYAAAKEGIAGFTRSVARELGRENIRCNIILPRATVGTGGAEFGAAKYKDFSPLLNDLGRYCFGNRGHTLSRAGHSGGTPDHVANFVVWLSTSAASNLNGEAFFVAGEEIGLVSEPDVTQTVRQVGPWSAEDMDQIAASLTTGLYDRFAVKSNR